MINIKFTYNIISLIFLLLLLASYAIPAASAGLYKVDVDLPPQNPVENLVVTYTLPAGVIYKEDSLTISGAAISADIIELSSPNDGTEDVTITWTFNSVDHDPDQNILIEFDGIVANVTGNQDGVQLPAGIVSYTYTGLSGAQTGKSLPTNIVEPDLKIEKRRVSENNMWIDYELWVYHTSESHSDAFDVVITDVVPLNRDYKDGS